MAQLEKTEAQLHIFSRIRAIESTILNFRSCLQNLSTAFPMSEAVGIQNSHATVFPDLMSSAMRQLPWRIDGLPKAFLSERRMM
jgi:hypothetical protein